MDIVTKEKPNKEGWGSRFVIVDDSLRFHGETHYTRATRVDRARSSRTPTTPRPPGTPLAPRRPRVRIDPDL